jgi:hypothetical protein
MLAVTLAGVRADTAVCKPFDTVPRVSLNRLCARVARVRPAPLAAAGVAVVVVIFVALAVGRAIVVDVLHNSHRSAQLNAEQQGRRKPRCRACRRF